MFIDSLQRRPLSAGLQDGTGSLTSTARGTETNPVMSARDLVRAKEKRPTGVRNQTSRIPQGGLAII